MKNIVIVIKFYKYNILIIYNKKIKLLKYRVLSLYI